MGRKACKEGLGKKGTKGKSKIEDVKTKWVNLKKKRKGREGQGKECTERGNYIKRNGKGEKGKEE